MALRSPVTIGFLMLAAGGLLCVAAIALIYVPLALALLGLGLAGFGFLILRGSRP
jgi:hypothetical protein